MEAVLFNLNDVVLLLALVECFILSVLVLFITNISVVKRCFLSLFLLSMGADFVDTLIYWAIPIKSLFPEEMIFPFYIFKFFGLLAAPALYLYVKSVLFSDFRFSRKTLLHFLPAFTFLALLPVYMLSRGSEFIIQAKYDYGLLFDDPPFQVYRMAKSLIFVVYGVLSYRLLANYHRYLEQGYSNVKGIDQFWLRLLVAGFLGIWLAYFASYLSHLILDSAFLSYALGLFGNYLNLLFINALVVYGLVKPLAFRGVDEFQSFPENSKLSDAQLTKIVEMIDSSMKKYKYYLDPEITLDQLASSLGLSRKLVSQAINKKSNKNFFEFVNEYRIARAKEILGDPSRSDSMLDIMDEAGFNSKSTFNRCFKNATNMTPSEYRAQSQDAES